VDEEDPRVMELNYLAALDRAPNGIPHGRGASGRFRQMLLHLLRQGCVQVRRRPTDAEVVAGAVGYEKRKSAMSMVLVGILALTVEITHAGRLQIYRLRDELRANRDREPFGVLFDRRAFERELPSLLPFASPTQPLSLLYLDIDNFKPVNEGPGGHPAGDAAIKRFFQVVADVVGSRGDSFRVGGDEVVVVLPDTDLASAEKVAEAIRAEAERALAPHCVQGQPPLSTSIGVLAVLGPCAAVEAMARVDALERKAKTAGKNRVEKDSFSPT
jgi:diguanylate cyclase (GGDEF)-like protein